MENIKYVQVKDPDSGALSESYLLEVEAQNVIFEDKENLVEKMAKKSDKAIYGDNEVNLGRIEDSEKGLNSITLGTENIASGDYATATGYNTIAAGDHSHVEGRYNIEDIENRYAFIIGNGYLPEVTEEIPSPDPIRSNAFAVDWEGKVYAKTFINGDGAELYPSLKSIFVNDVEYNLNGGSLILQAGDNITLTPGVTEGTDNEDIVDGSLTVIISSTGGGSGSGGGGDGEYLPLAGGKVYGPVIIERDTEKVPELEGENFGGSFMIKGSSSQTIFGSNTIDTSSSGRKAAILYINRTTKNMISLGPGSSEDTSFIFNPKTGTGGVGWVEGVKDLNLNVERGFIWGINLNVEADYGHAFGSNSLVTGIGGSADGYNNMASGAYARAEGYNVEARGDYSHAEGEATFTMGRSSHTEGYATSAYGQGAHAEGVSSRIYKIYQDIDINTLLDNWNEFDTISDFEDDLTQKFSAAYGIGSHVQGIDCLAIGDYSSAGGIQTIANGRASSVEGIGSYVNGSGSKVNGIESSVNGINSYAYGFQNTVLGSYSEAKGNRSSIKGNYSSAYGYNILAKGEYISIFGKENIIKANNSFIFGSFQKSKNELNYSFMFGNSNQLQGDYSFIFGNNIELIQGDYSFIFGKENQLQTLSEGSVVLGEFIQSQTNSPQNLITIGNNLIINSNHKNSYSFINKNIMIGKDLIINQLYTPSSNASIPEWETANINNNIIIGEKNTLQGSRINRNIILGYSNIIDKPTKFASFGQNSSGTPEGLQYSNNWGGIYAGTLGSYDPFGYTGVVPRGISSHIVYPQKEQWLDDYQEHGYRTFGSIILGQDNAVYCSSGSTVIGTLHDIKFSAVGSVTSGIGHKILYYHGMGAGSGIGNSIEGIGHIVNNINMFGSHIEGGWHNLSFPSNKTMENYGGDIIQFSYSHFEGVNHQIITVSNDFVSNASSNVFMGATHFEGWQNKIRVYLDYTYHVEGVNNVVGHGYYQTSHHSGHGLSTKDFSAHIEGTGNQFYEERMAVVSDGGIHIEGFANIFTYNSGTDYYGWLGRGMHIEGCNNTLQRVSTHGTFAGAHIEGAFNSFRALQDGTHIEGYTNRITKGGMYPGDHIEGSQNIITRDNEYTDNDNSGGDHIEGYQNQVYFSSGGYGNHIEGAYNTLTEGVNGPCGLHIEGYRNTCLNNRSGYPVHIEGQNNQAVVSNHIEGIQNKALGMWSHVEGNCCYTNDQSSMGHAEGYGSSIFSTACHAEGFYAIAYGAYSHAEGYGNTPGEQLTDFSFTKWKITNNLIAYGTGSHVEGRCTYAGGSFAHAEGNCTAALAHASHTEGEQTFIHSNAAYSHAEGYKTIVSAPNAHAEGYSNYSHAELEDFSYNTWLNKKFLIACAPGAHAEGQNTYAGAPYTHAEGNATQALNVGAHAEGNETISANQFSHAQNIQTIASGVGSHAGGYQSKAIGTYSFAHGNNAIAASHHQFVIGKYNIEDEDGEYAFILGNGGPQVDEETGETTDEIIYSNAFTIDWDGKVSATLFNGAINTHKIGNADFNGTQDITLEDIGVPSKEELDETYSKKEDTVKSIEIKDYEINYTNGIGETKSYQLPVTEMPIGTIITNDNPNSSGFEYGNWKCLGKNTMILSPLDETATTISEVIAYVWKRIED